MASLQPTQRFSDRVADYVKYRPDYPVSLLEHLVERHGLQSQHVVSDIGMGTGLLTQLLLKHSQQVYYEKFLRTHAPDYAAVSQRRPTAAELADFFAPATMKTAMFDHDQTFDFEGLKGRLLSCSYAPTKTAANYGVMLVALRSLFDQYSHDDQLHFRYTTYLYCARLAQKPQLAQGRKTNF